MFVDVMMAIDPKGAKISLMGDSPEVEMQKGLIKSLTKLAPKIKPEFARDILHLILAGGDPDVLRAKCLLAGIQALFKTVKMNDPTGSIWR